MGSAYGMENKQRELESQAQDQHLKAAVEAIVYVTDEPVTVEQITNVIGGAGRDAVLRALRLLQEEYRKDDHGLEVREIAGGYKMSTKPEHHETIRRFVKELTPPLKLSMAALETLATIAYRQPITIPEIQQIRGVHAVAVIKTLLDRKLITTAGRKNVIGRPVLYKTTKEFLKQFGLSSLEELPSMEEFEELARAAVGQIAPEAAATSSGAPLPTPDREPSDGA